MHPLVNLTYCGKISQFSENCYHVEMFYFQVVLPLQFQQKSEKGVVWSQSPWEGNSKVFHLFHMEINTKF